MRKYVGIPHADYGRDRNGVDCWGLVRLFYKENYGIELPSYSYGSSSKEHALKIVQRCTMFEWFAVSKPVVGDIVLLRQMGLASHVGVVVEKECFLHCEKGLGVVKQSLKDERWKRRIVSYHHHVDRKGVQVVTCPSPLTQERVVMMVEPGLTLQAIVDQSVTEPWRSFAHVSVEGNPIESKHWSNAKVKEGAKVIINVVPHDSGRGVLRAILTIAVMVWAGPAGRGFAGNGASFFGGIFGAAGGAVAGTLGLLTINALIPPPRATFEGLASLDKPNAYSITGVQNRSNLYGAIPVILGTHKIYPPYGSKPYTVIEGSDQYLHALFILGYGELSWDSATEKIGETLASSFTDIESQSVVGTAGDYQITKYATDNVTEEALSIILEHNIPQTRTTEPDTDLAIVDVLLPGLTVFNNDGSLNTRRVHITVEFRETGTSGIWSNPIGYFVKGLTLTNGGSGYIPGRYNLEFTDASDTGSGAAATCDVTIDTSASDPKLPQDAPDQTEPNINLDPGKIKSLSIPPSIGASAVNLGGYGNDYTGAVTVALPAGAGGGAGFACTVSLQEGHIFEAATLQPIRHSFELDFPSRSQWDVRITRTSEEGDGVTEIDVIQWTAIRSIGEGASINFEPPYLAKHAIKVKATGQLNGIIDSFNLIVSSICKAWNGANWIADQKTSNPADLFRYVLQGPFNNVAVADSRIDLDSLELWADFCDTKGFEFDAVLDSHTTLREILERIAAAGRASVNMFGNTYGVIIDVEQITPIQVFTPRNSFDFQLSRNFVDLPHGYRVRYVDKAQDYLQKEVIVYRNGYTSGNATDFEQGDFFGACNVEHAKKLARYHLAVAEYRQQVYAFKADFEHIVCQAGDLIEIRHDVCFAGLSDGRILEVNDDWLRVDEVCTMVAGTYVVRYRKSDQSVGERNLTLVPGDHKILGKNGGAAFDCEADDLFTFGETGSATIKILVKSVEPIGGLKAQLTCVPYAPAVYTYDSGTIPATETTMSIPAELMPPNSPRVFEGKDFLYREGGNAKQGVYLRWVHPENTIADSYEIQIQKPGSDVWEPNSNTILDQSGAADLNNGTYNFRIRTLRGLQASGWVAVAVYVDAMIEVPNDVTNARISYKGNACNITWKPIEDVRDTLYEIRYSFALVSWKVATLVATTMFSEHAPQIKGYYYIKARCNGMYSVNKAITYVVFATINVNNAKKTKSEIFAGIFSGKAYPRLPLPFGWDSNWRGWKTGWIAGAWDDTYDPSTEGLPTADGWTQLASDDDATINDKGELEITGTGASYWKKTPGVAANQFMTAEFEVRCNEGDKQSIQIFNNGSGSSIKIIVKNDRIYVDFAGSIAKIFVGDFTNKIRTIRIELKESLWLYLDDELLYILDAYIYTGGTSDIYFGRFEPIISAASQFWMSVKFAIDTATMDNQPNVGDGWTRVNTPVLQVITDTDYLRFLADNDGYKRTPAMAIGDCLQLQLPIFDLPCSTPVSFEVTLSNNASGYCARFLISNNVCTIEDGTWPAVTLAEITDDYHGGVTPKLLSFILYSNHVWFIKDRKLLWHGKTNGGTLYGNRVQWILVCAGGTEMRIAAASFQHDIFAVKGISVMPGDGGEYTIDVTDQVNLGYSAETAVTSDLAVLGINDDTALIRFFDLLESSDLLLELDLLTGGPEHYQNDNVESQISIHDGTAFDDFTRLVPGLYYGEQFNLRAVIQATKNDPLHIDGWEWSIDMPDVQDKQAVITLAGGDLVVTWNKSYQAAPQVVGSIIGGAMNDDLEIKTITSTTCIVNAKNAGARVVRNVHIIANGY